MSPIHDASSRVTVETIDYPKDARGLVLEPLGPAEIPAQRNAHLVLTVPGAIRGNHYHRAGTEVAVVLGPALVRYRDVTGLQDCEIAPGQAVRLRFPPGVPHAMLNIGTSPMVIFSFNTQPHDPARPDVVREVLIETE
jgi:UDP-2-acetamido-2,6-beta-L-arabino-hexul-4-ose reductase